MKTYNSIGKDIVLNEEVWVFDKPDGSNIRAYWEHKKGFVQFGSRTKLIDENTPILSQAIALIKAQEDKFTKMFTDNKIKSATCFFEFLGPSSNFGQHIESEEKEVFLFDIAVEKRGLVYPPKYIEMTKGFKIAKLIYQGIMTEEMVEQIKENKFPGISLEGVVIKLNRGTPGLPFMFKIKTYKWLNLLLSYCKGDKELFEILS